MKPNRGTKAYRWWRRHARYWGLRTSHFFDYEELYDHAFNAYLAGYARALQDVRNGTTDQRNR